MTDIFLKFYKKLLIESQVKEAAKGSAPEYYAIALQKDGESFFLTMYDYSAILKDKEAVLYRQFDVGGWIKGHIGAEKLPSSMGKCYGSYEIFQSAAEKGYGPLLYDTIMKVVNNQGAPLTPDRSSVSSDAGKVWSHYKFQRSDVEKLPFDSILKPHRTPTPQDDCKTHGKVSMTNPFSQEEIDFAYRMNGTSHLASVGMKLIKKHENFRRDFQTKIGVDLDSFIHSLGEQYFEQRYM